MASSLRKQWVYAYETGSRGAQIPRKTGPHKNWLKPATNKMVLSMVWSLTSNSLHLHYYTKNQSPHAMKSAIIFPRLTIKGQEVCGGLVLENPSLP